MDSKSQNKKIKLLTEGAKEPWSLGLSMSVSLID
jgi:hypothetical protein